MYLDLDQFRDLQKEAQGYLDQSRKNNPYEDVRYDEGYMQALHDVESLCINNRKEK